MASFRDIKRKESSAEQDFAERLHELFEYDPETGELFWKRRPAGSVNNNGYMHVIVDGRIITVHRIAFAMMTGRLPEDEIDHKNRKRSDNRWENLREADRSQNAHNTGMYSTNTSGVKGVCWHKANKRWHATITVRGVKHHIGYFQTLEEAAAARSAAKLRLVGEL